jgi:hypothetical protein
MKAVGTGMSHCVRLDDRGADRKSKSPTELSGKRYWNFVDAADFKGMNR